MADKGSRRSYGDACGISRALDVIGERWALMVVRELLLGPKRFTDIRTSLPNLSADVLAQRLRGLEESGIVRKRELPPPAASKVYELTPSGLALEPTLIELGRWGGANAPEPTDDMGMSVDSHLVSLRTLFDAERAAGFEALVRLQLDADSFAADVSAEGIDVERDEAADADATIFADPGTLLDVLHGRRQLADALEAGDMRFEGNEEIATRFTTLFPLPAPAAV